MTVSALPGCHNDEDVIYLTRRAVNTSTTSPLKRSVCRSWLLLPNPFGQKIQTYYFCSAYRSFLSEEKIVQAHADMQARDLMEVSIITEHCESVLGSVLKMEMTA